MRLPQPVTNLILQDGMLKHDSVVQWGYGIHHPAGIVKKIAITHNSIYSYPAEITWENNAISPVNSHWFLRFDTGSTEGGSSGSPLFDNHNRIIGQLHGGAGGNDYYGKLSYSWHSSSFPSMQLRHWLDPDSSGIKIMDGYSPAGNDPEAFFYTDFQQVCAGNSIRLKNGSLFNPDSFKWTFTPSTVTYYNNTSDTSRNPVVSFDSLGAYSITLKATKNNTSNTRERKNYIISDTTIDVHIISYAGQIISFEDFKDFFLVAKGGINISMEIIRLKWKIRYSFFLK